jgi:hypothetical protein
MRLTRLLGGIDGGSETTCRWCRRRQWKGNHHRQWLLFPRSPVELEAMNLPALVSTRPSLSTFLSPRSCVCVLLSIGGR